MDGCDLGFMQDIRDAFVSRQSNQFLLTGNVNDVHRCPWLSREESLSGKDYVPLVDYLTQRLTRNNRIVITYDLAKGIQFHGDGARERAREVYLTLFKLQEHDAGTKNFDEVVTKSANYIFPSLLFLRKLCQASSRRAKSRTVPFAIIIEHTDSILPASPVAQMNDPNRQRLIFFKEWLTEGSLIDSDHIVILVSETASAVNEAIRTLPHMVNVNLPLPNADERQRFLRWCLQTRQELSLSGTQRSFVALSAGMTLVGMDQTMRWAQFKKGKLTRQDFIVYLNRLLTSQIGEHIEVVHPDHSLNDVIGNAALKTELDRLKKALASGDPSVAPVGILVAGPNGVGKTYIATAWAGECQRILIILKNLRGSYFGQTDQIFEKIRNVLEVLGNVIVIVDEADTVFAAPREGVHATEQRLFGNVIKMMGDPGNRSRIVWLLMTARPDNLAPDLKRSGRCGLHLPVFDPEGPDREAFVDHVLSECGLRLASFSTEQRDAFMTRTAGYSPADFRELVAELKTEALLRKSQLDPPAVLDVIENVIPGTIGLQRRLQTLQAMLHCSRRSLLPVSLRETSREDVLREIADVRRHLAAT